MHLLSVWLLLASVLVVAGLLLAGALAWFLFRRARTSGEEVARRTEGDSLGGGAPDEDGGAAEHLRRMRRGERIGAAGVAAALVLGAATAVYGVGMRDRLAGTSLRGLLAGGSAPHGTADAGEMADLMTAALDAHDPEAVGALGCGGAPLLAAAQVATEDVELVLPLVSRSTVEVEDAGGTTSDRPARLTAWASIAGVDFRLDGSLRLVRDQAGLYCFTAGPGTWQVVHTGAHDVPAPEPVAGLPVSAENCGASPEDLRSTLEWAWFDLASPDAVGEPVVLVYAALGYCSPGAQEAVFSALSGQDSKQATYTSLSADLVLDRDEGARTLLIRSQPWFQPPVSRTPTKAQRAEWLSQERPMLKVTASERDSGEGYVVDAVDVEWVTLPQIYRDQ